MTPAPESPGFDHTPVLLDDVVAVLAATPSGWAADCTLGGAGHAAALLERAPHLRLLGLDRDASARDAALARLARFGDRARVEGARFDDLEAVCARHGITELSAVLFDLGVSSPQLDHLDRGFSHRGAGPLDMRMDRSSGGLTADDIVNGADQHELAGLLRRGGEERFAARVARAIVAARPIADTAALADIVRAAIPAPARRRGGDPANRSFQAIRIAVNDELTILRPALQAALGLLAVGGRLLVLSYHSGEDRIVKDVLGAATGGPSEGRPVVRVPRGLPVDAVPAPFRRLRGLPRTAPDAEVAGNRRAASVRLRAVERTAPDTREDT